MQNASSRTCLRSDDGYLLKVKVLPKTKAFQPAGRRSNAPRGNNQARRPLLPLCHALDAMPKWYCEVAGEVRSMAVQDFRDVVAPETSFRKVCSEIPNWKM
jgi:hypothetical protein